jgi:hypothetical protein
MPQNSFSKIVNGYHKDYNLILVGFLPTKESQHECMLRRCLFSVFKVVTPEVQFHDIIQCILFNSSKHD